MREHGLHFVRRFEPHARMELIGGGAIQKPLTLQESQFHPDEPFACHCAANIIVEEIQATSHIMYDE